jgi:hypothetical protein
MSTQGKELVIDVNLLKLANVPKLLEPKEKTNRPRQKPSGGQEKDEDEE